MSLGSRFSAWMTRHGHALVSSAGHAARRPMGTLLTVLVMGIALALPLGLDVLVRNVRTATGDFANAVGLSVYLKSEVSEARGRVLARSAAARSEVQDAKLITADEALKEFRDNSGFGAALDALTDNPLPHVIAVQPRSGVSPAQLETLRRFLAAWPEVDSVQLDRDWANRFNAMLELMQTLLSVAAVLLGLGVLAVVGNTIRLEIQNRRAEIEVTKLVGGSNTFVRRPFLYTGTWYGVLAGFTAWLVVSGAMLALGRPAARLAAAYGSDFLLVGPGFDELGQLLLTGLVLGWLGAWIAASHQIAQIEPGTS
ncbi:MAG: permease-like cell division protein FtsX [Steroidobacteraceae bacterium]